MSIRLYIFSATFYSDYWFIFTTHPRASFPCFGNSTNWHASSFGNSPKWHLIRAHLTQLTYNFQEKNYVLWATSFELFLQLHKLISLLRENAPTSPRSLIPLGCRLTMQLSYECFIVSTRVSLNSYLKSSLLNSCRETSRQCMPIGQTSLVFWRFFSLSSQARRVISHLRLTLSIFKLSFKRFIRSINIIFRVFIKILHT